MGQAMRKSAQVAEKKNVESQTGFKIEEMNDFIDRHWEKLNNKEPPLTEADFYHEICLIIQEMNEKIKSGIQVEVPTVETLRRSFKKHHADEKTVLEKQQFTDIMKEVMLSAHFKGKWPYDTLLYFFGLPIGGWLVKQSFFPDLVSDNVFIPTVTSGTVAVLAFKKKL